MRILEGLDSGSAFPPATAGFVQSPQDGIGWNDFSALSTWPPLLKNDYFMHSNVSTCVSVHYVHA